MMSLGRCRPGRALLALEPVAVRADAVSAPQPTPAIDRLTYDLSRIGYGLGNYDILLRRGGSTAAGLPIDDMFQFLKGQHGPT